MKTVGPPMSSRGPSTLTTVPARVRSSAAHGWHGTLALDIPGTPRGECRHNHVRVALQLWWQPLAVRALRGPSSWRTLEPGARVWLPGEEQHFEWRQAARVNVVLLTPKRIEEILERPYAQLNLGAWRGVDFRSVFVSRLVAAMSDDLAQDCPAGPLVGDSLTAALVAYLDAGPRQVAVARSRPGLSAQGFERALQYIEANLAQPLRMAELAKEADCSPKQLSRAFQERRGMFPHQHVLERRVERAACLIDAGDLNLAQVAVAVGFADQSQMTKIFRKQVGTTPGRLRKRLHAWIDSGMLARGGERTPE